MNIIETKDLVKKYKDFEAVKGVSLAVNEGEIFGLLGPNGAGKTTFISMIVGILTITSGSIEVFGKDINKNAKEIKKNIGYVPQDLAFFDKLNAYDNVLYWGRLYGLKGEELKEKTKKALEYTGLWDRRKDLPTKYSGGMKRRLNIACAIVHQPKLLFMDEPTVGVDPQSRNSILESIKELNANGTTVVYTSHYMEEVEAICDRVAIIDFGQVIALGSIDELIKKNIKDQRFALQIDHALSEQDLDKLRKLPGVLSVDTDAADELAVHVNPSILTTVDFFQNLMEDNVKIRTIDVERPSLETVFLTLTGKTLRD